MKAMIFAAGLGTRLKPLTDSMPKAMVPIAGKPLLEHVIRKLIAAGFDEIIINVHHFADQIIDFLKANDNFGVRIAISDETDALLETGGGIKKAHTFFDDGKPFLIHNVDILSDIDLKALYESHVNTAATATLVVSERNTSRYLLFDDSKLMRGWINKSTNDVKTPYPEFNASQYQELAFSGIHIMNPEIFELMYGFDGSFSIINFYLSVCDNVNIAGYVAENLNMVDVGKLDSLEVAERFVRGEK